MEALTNAAPSPAQGSYADGFAPLAETFAAHLRDGAEVGAGLAVYHHGKRVVDLWGGHANREAKTPWTHDTRVLVFSVTKGLAAMALALLADRGQLDWDAPVATYWPELAANGKAGISVRTLVNHRAGLVGLDEVVTMDDCLDPARYRWLVALLERQRPAWEPGTAQGYHAVTYGMYVRELFERIAHESLGTFLRRELFEPLDADVSLGTPAEVDARMATLYPPPTALRVLRMVGAAIRGATPEGRIARSAVRRDSAARAAFLNPRLAGGIVELGSERVRRAELAWVSATASAHGLARAYLPFASGGTAVGRAFLRGSTLEPVYARQSWAERDRVLQKPIGWSQGFLKDETTLFSPNPESFGHAGMGGSLGWCDPVAELTIGYVMNRLDWHVRSPRAVALCRALYACAPVRDQRQNR